MGEMTDDILAEEEHLASLGLGQPPEPEPEPEVAASILVTFEAGTLDMSVSTPTGIVTNAHLWAAASLLDRIANQMWNDQQTAIRQRAAMERAATQKVMQQLNLGGRRS